MLKWSACLWVYLRPLTRPMTTVFASGLIGCCVQEYVGLWLLCVPFLLVASVFAFLQLLFSSAHPLASVLQAFSAFPQFVSHIAV